MSKARTAHADRHQPGLYEIRIQGHLAERWAERFAGLRIRHHSDGTTTLTGSVIDQAALHGLLRGVRDLGLPLVSVILVDLTPPDEPGAGVATDQDGMDEESRV